MVAYWIGWRELESTIRPVICAFDGYNELINNPNKANFLMISIADKGARWPGILVKS
jgi:hypothetical protein